MHPVDSLLKRCLLKLVTWPALNRLMRAVVISYPSQFLNQDVMQDLASQEPEYIMLTASPLSAKFITSSKKDINLVGQDLFSINPS